MRRARTPQTACGSSRQTRDLVRGTMAGVVRTIAIAAALAVIVASGASAQDPSALSPGTAKSSSFPRQKGGITGGPLQKIDKAQPLHLQGDELIYDTKGSRVTARGNVEIYYNNYILTADEVVYDQAANTLIADGNVRIREPDGAVISADHITLTDDFRDGFIQSLRVVASDETRIAAAGSEPCRITANQSDMLHRGGPARWGWHACFLQWSCGLRLRRRRRSPPLRRSHPFLSPSWSVPAQISVLIPVLSQPFRS